MASHHDAPTKNGGWKQRFSPSELPQLFEWKPLPRRRFRYQRSFSKAELAPLLAAVLLFFATAAAPVGTVLKTIAFAAAALVAGFPVLFSAFQGALRRKWPDEDCLMLVSSLFAFLSGHYAAGALIAILGRSGQMAEAYVLARSERGVDALSELLPEKAHVEEEFGMVDVVPEELREDDLFLVYEGESIPTDGVIVTGESVVDAGPIGGFAQQRVSAGDKVLSGSVNRGETLRIRASSSFADSALARELRLLHRANRERTDLEDTIESYAAYYAPALIGLSLLVGILLPLVGHRWAGCSWENCLMAAALFLLLASPGPLILSVPLAFLGALTGAFRRGLYCRGKYVLEALFHVKTVAFGKTGTVTDGAVRVTEVFPEQVSKERLLALAAEAEGPFRHPIAMAIKTAAGWNAEESEPPSNAEEIPGRGVTALIDGKRIYVGNAALLEENGLSCRIPERSGTAVHVALGDRYWGYILLEDCVREGAFDAIEELRSTGIRTITLLTGDVRSVSSQLARKLNFDMVKSELSPKQKLSAISFLRRSLGKGETLAYVGDGFHDAAMFEKADIGIALKPTGDSEDETSADLVLMDDELMRVPSAIRLSVQLRRIMMENIALFCVSRVLILFLGLIHWLSLSAAAFLTMLFGVVLMLNALRSFLLKEQISE